MNSGRGDGRWHCPVSGCGAFYPTQLDRRKHVTRRHQYPTVLPVPSNPDASVASRSTPVDGGHTQQSGHTINRQNWQTGTSTSTSHMSPLLATQQLQTVQGSMQLVQDSDIPQTRTSPNIISTNPTLSGSSRSVQPIPRYSHRNPSREARRVTSATPNHAAQQIQLLSSSSQALGNATQPITISHTLRQEPQPIPQEELWTPETESLLLNMIKTKMALARRYPETSPISVTALFTEFQQNSGLWLLERDEQKPLVFRRFVAKVRELQDSLRKVEISNNCNKTRDNTHLPGGQAVFPSQANLSTASQISTPPQTPVIPADQRDAMLLIWKNSEPSKQLSLFQELIRTAKDLEGLGVEWESYREEWRKDKGKSRIEAAQQSTEQLQGATPIYTPPVDAGLDLNAMIEARVKKARLKRQREEEETRLQSEATVASRDVEEQKRQKTDHIFLSPQS